MVAGLISICVRGYQTKEKIDKEGVETICRFMYCKRFAKTSEAQFAYYVDSVLYKNGGCRCPDNYERYKGRYFRMRYLQENPNQFSVDLTKQVVDTVEIRRAGFKMIH